MGISLVQQQNIIFYLRNDRNKNNHLPSRIIITFIQQSRVATVSDPRTPHTCCTLMAATQLLFKQFHDVFFCVSVFVLCKILTATFRIMNKVFFVSHA